MSETLHNVIFQDEAITADKENMRKRVERHFDSTNRLIVARAFHHGSLSVRPFSVCEVVSGKTQTQFLQTLVRLVMRGITWHHQPNE